MKKQSLVLLEQIIEKAIEEDKKNKKKSFAEKEYGKSVGEDWMVFHLKILKELLTTEK